MSPTLVQWGHLVVGLWRVRARRNSSSVNFPPWVLGFCAGFESEIPRHVLGVSLITSPCSARSRSATRTSLTARLDPTRADLVCGQRLVRCAQDLENRISRAVVHALLPTSYSLDQLIQPRSALRRLPRSGALEVRSTIYETPGRVRLPGGDDAGAHSRAVPRNAFQNLSSQPLSSVTQALGSATNSESHGM